MKFRLLLGTVVVAALASMPAQAQVGGGTLRGKVLDKDGKPVQGAIIRAEQTSSHQTDEAKTGRNGEYAIVGMYGGQYRAAVIVGGKILMVKGDGAGNAIFVNNATDTTLNFDLREAPATPPATTMSAAPPPKDEKERDAQKKAVEELKGAFSAGTAAMAAKNYEEAVKQFQLAAEKDPTQSAVFANLGVALSNLKKYDDAVAAYRKSIELKPDDPAVHSLVALSLASAGKVDEATQQIQEVAKLDPSMAGQSYYNTGAILTNRGKSKEAVEMFKKAIEIDPKNAPSYYQLGLAYFGSADTIPQAVTALEKFLQLQPTGPDADAAKGLIEAAKAQIRK